MYTDSFYTDSFYTDSFHCEWLTVGIHRILLDCRHGFPGDEMRFIAQVVAKTCDNNSEVRARVVRIYYDDQRSRFEFNIASGFRGDQRLEEIVRTVLGSLFPGMHCLINVMIVLSNAEGFPNHSRSEDLGMHTGCVEERYPDED